MLQMLRPQHVSPKATHTRQPNSFDLTSRVVPPRRDGKQCVRWLAHTLGPIPVVHRSQGDLSGRRHHVLISRPHSKAISSIAECVRGTRKFWVVALQSKSSDRGPFHAFPSDLLAGQFIYAIERRCKKVASRMQRKR